MGSRLRGNDRRKQSRPVSCLRRNDRQEGTTDTGTLHVVPAAAGTTGKRHAGESMSCQYHGHLLSFHDDFFVMQRAGCTTERFRIQWTLPIPRRREEGLMTESEYLLQAAVRAGDATLCAADGGELVYRLTGRGVSALLTAVDEERVISHGPLDWGDKLVGRAAALLFTLVHPRSVFALTMSTGAQDVLRAAGIPFTCDTVSLDVLNRAGTEPCPMEAAVAGISEPLVALETLKQVSRTLSDAGRNNAPRKGST